jgi:hypothetical protein
MFLYTYEMGDSWEHKILVEKVLPADPKMRYPVIDGRQLSDADQAGTGGEAPSSAVWESDRLQ